MERLSPSYSRQNPSARYLEMLHQYEQMHASSPLMFAGLSLTPHIGKIKKMIQDTDSKTLLDYGSGKGVLYSQKIDPETKQFDPERGVDLKNYWGLEEIALYDPGYPPFQKLPHKTFDAVICTDVLEHCPREDISWILEEIFSLSRKAVYLHIACYLAEKKLPDQTNCHVINESPEWWQRQILPCASLKRVPSILTFTEMEKSSWLILP